MRTFYKATRPDGTDFYSGTVRYEVGKRVRPRDRVPRERARLCGPGMLHSATVPTETLVGGSSWPCRLFVVEGNPVAGLDERHPHKAGFRELRVVEELPAWQVFGPQGEDVVALIERAGRLTADEMQRFAQVGTPIFGTAVYKAEEKARAAARDAVDAARYAAWIAARHAAEAAAGETRLGGSTSSAARGAAWGAARDAAGDAAMVLVARDLISDEDFRTLYGPWESVIGE